MAKVIEVVTTYRRSTPAPFFADPLYDFTKMIPTNNDPHRGTPTVTGSDRIVAALENEGVERTRHEQPTAFMAPTYGWLTGKPGVCISSLGPGTLNFCFISKVLS
jgi:hypothetical protein